MLWEIQTNRLQVDQHVGNDANKSDGAKEVSPHIHCLVMNHEERASCILVGVETDSVARFQKQVINDELVYVGVIDFTNILLYHSRFL